MLKQVPHSPPEGYSTPVEFVVRRLCESHRCSRQRATVRKWDRKISLSRFSTAFIPRSKNIHHYYFGKQLPSEASHSGDNVFCICVEFISCVCSKFVLAFFWELGRRHCSFCCYRRHIWCPV